MGSLGQSTASQRSHQNLIGGCQAQCAWRGLVVLEYATRMDQHVYEPLKFMLPHAYTHDYLCFQLPLVWTSSSMVECDREGWPSMPLTFLLDLEELMLELLAWI